MGIVIKLSDIEKNIEYLKQLTSHKIYALADSDSVPVTIFNMALTHSINIEIMPKCPENDFALGFFLAQRFSGSAEDIYILTDKKCDNSENICFVDSAKDIPILVAKPKTIPKTQKEDRLSEPIEDNTQLDAVKRIKAIAAKNKDSMDN